MSDLISREDACEAVKNEMESWLEGDRCDYRNVVDAIMDLPSAEKAQLSEEDATKGELSELVRKKKVLITITYNEMGIIIDTKAEEVAQPDSQPTCNNLATDTISRQDAIDVVDKYDFEFPQYMEKFVTELRDAMKADLKCDIANLPSAEPERLTDDDFEAIRIHLNAQKEKLCNQQRWEEAEEYQCIIDRFMAFASAEPERKGRRMYAIRNRKTKKWVYGTDYRYSPRRQRTSFDRALTYEDYDHAKLAFMSRQCGKDYEIVPVVITEVRGENE